MAAAPAISVILPVYGVAEYLPACLDSILGQHAAGVPGGRPPGSAAAGVPGGRPPGSAQTVIEVIAVDDASPDDCGRILDHRAAADPRLQVLHLERNAGQGNARNIGLQRASGDYVWFVDADDLMAAGALAAVTAALAAGKPDVLLIDWESSYPGGRTAPNPGRALLAGVPPGGCTLEERPQLINLTMTSWSKLFRRDFLLGLGVGFAAGIHEDIVVTCAALISAREIGAVTQVCYRYRRQRHGSAMATTSHAQWAVFAAYEHVFAILDSRAAAGLPVSDGLRAAIFERAIWHYSTVLETTGPGIGRIGLPGLVPRPERRQFFRRMHQDFERYRPAGYRHPGGARGAKMRLIERGVYPAYSLLEPLNQARVAVRTAVRARRG
jgi:CDP-glycerol glycerophosphotransferase